jgi:hypothetical protein
VGNEAELGYRGDTIDRFGVADAICHDTTTVDSFAEPNAVGSVVVRRQRAGGGCDSVVSDGIQSESRSLTDDTQVSERS